MPQDNITPIKQKTFADILAERKMGRADTAPEEIEKIEQDREVKNADTKAKSEAQDYQKSSDEKLEKIREYLNKKTGNNFQNTQEVKSFLSTNDGKKSFVNAFGKSYIKQGVWNNDMTNDDIVSWIDDKFGLKQKFDSKGNVIYNPNIDVSQRMVLDDIQGLDEKTLGDLDDYLADVYEGNEKYNTEVAYLPHHGMDKGVKLSQLDNSEAGSYSRAYKWLDTKAKEIIKKYEKKGYVNINPQAALREAAYEFRKVKDVAKKHADDISEIQKEYGYGSVFDDDESGSRYRLTLAHMLNKNLTLANQPFTDDAKMASFGKGLVEGLADLDNIFFGGFDTNDKFVIDNICQKIIDNNIDFSDPQQLSQLSDTEVRIFNEAMRQAELQMLRAGNVSAYYEGGAMAGASADMMVEFALTGAGAGWIMGRTAGALGKAASAAVRAGGAVSKIAKAIDIATKGIRTAGAALDKAGKIGKATNAAISGATDVARGVGNVAMKSAVQSAISPRTLAATLGANQRGVEIDSEGKVAISDEPNGKDILNAALDQYIEYATEMSSQNITMKGLGALKNVAKVFAPNMNKYGALNTMTKLFERNEKLAIGGFDSVLEPVEEIYGNWLREATGVITEEEYNQFWTKDNWQVMLLGFAPMTAVSTGLNIRGLHRRRNLFNESNKSYETACKLAGLNATQQAELRNILCNAEQVDDVPNAIREYLSDKNLSYNQRNKLTITSANLALRNFDLELFNERAKFDASKVNDIIKEVNADLNKLDAEHKNEVAKERFAINNIDEQTLTDYIAENPEIKSVADLYERVVSGITPEAMAFDNYVRTKSYANIIEDTTNKEADQQVIAEMQDGKLVYITHAPKILGFGTDGKPEFDRKPTTIQALDVETGETIPVTLDDITIKGFTNDMSQRSEAMIETYKADIDFMNQYRVGDVITVGDTLVTITNIGNGNVTFRAKAAETNADQIPQEQTVSYEEFTDDDLGVKPAFELGETMDLPDGTHIEICARGVQQGGIMMNDNGKMHSDGYICKVTIPKGDTKIVPMSVDELYATRAALKSEDTFTQRKSIEDTKSDIVRKANGNTSEEKFQNAFIDTMNTIKALSEKIVKKEEELKKPIDLSEKKASDKREAVREEVKQLRVELNKYSSIANIIEQEAGNGVIDYESVQQQVFGHDVNEAVRAKADEAMKQSEEYKQAEIEKEKSTILDNAVGETNEERSKSAFADIMHTIKVLTEKVAKKKEELNKPIDLTAKDAQEKRATISSEAKTLQEQIDKYLNIANMISDEVGSDVIDVDQILSEIIPTKDGGKQNNLVDTIKAGLNRLRSNSDNTNNDTQHQRNQQLLNGMIDHLRGMGIDVITDENEAQRILEKANKKGIKVRTEGDDDVREQKVYHNSPADFDKFDTRYAKEDGVHGWGIYLSKNDIPQYAGEKEGERNKYIVDIPSNKHLLNLNSTDFYDLKDQLNERGIELDKKYLNGSYTIEDYYENVADELGSQKAASEFIASLGYKGMRYKDEDDGVGYVIFDENDAKITDHIQFFKLPSGEAYGFTIGGKIYIDTKIATAETAIHEYAHLWASAVKKDKPAEWNGIVEKMKRCGKWNYVKQLYPELHDDSDIADEVLAQFSGARGYEKLRNEMNRMAKDGTPTEQLNIEQALRNIKAAIDEFWDWVLEVFGLEGKYSSPERVADTVMRDFINGFNPNVVTNGVDFHVKDNNLRNNSLSLVDNAIATGEWNNEALAQLDNLITDIQNGKVQFRRYKEVQRDGSERKYESDGRTAQAAAIVLRGEASTSSTKQRLTKLQRRRRDEADSPRQERVIEDWAKASGIWYDDVADAVKDLSLLSNHSTEAIVYDSGETVTKTISLEHFHTPQLAVDRIILHNQLFPETALTIKGFGRDANGDFQIVVEQPFVKGVKPTIEQIKEYVERKGFNQQKTPTTYKNDDYILSDLHEGNVIHKTDKNDTPLYYENGVPMLMFIDTDMWLNTPDMGRDGTYEIDNTIASTQEQDNTDDTPRFSRLPNQNTKPDEAMRKIMEMWNTAYNEAQPAEPNKTTETKQQDEATAVLSNLAGHYTWDESNTISEAERKAMHGIQTHMGRSKEKAAKEGREWKESEFLEKLTPEQQEVYAKYNRVRNGFEIDRQDRIREAEDAVLADVRQTLRGDALKEAVERAEQQATAEGRKLTDAEKEEIRTTVAENMRNNKKRGLVTDAAMQSIYTFDMTMRKLAKGSMYGEGRAWNYFMRKWDKSRNQDIARNTGIAKAMQTKAAEFGLTMEDLLKLGEQTGIEVQYDNAGAKPTWINMSQVMMMYAWSKQGEAADKRFELAHISRESVDAAVAKMNEYPELKEFVDWVQSDMLPTLRDDYVSKMPYSERYKLKSINNYFPFKASDVEYVDKNKLEELTAQTQSQSQSSGGVIMITPSAMQDRANESAFTLDATFFSLLANHVRSMERFYNYSELVEDLREVFGNNKDIRNRIKMIDGDMLSDIEKANAILVGQISSEQPLNAFERSASKLLQNSILAKVAFKPYTAIKQLESMIVVGLYAEECKTAAVRNLTPSKLFYENVKWAEENMPMLYERFKSRSGGNELLAAANSQAFNIKDGDIEYFNHLINVAPNLQKSIRNKALYLNGVMDAVACAYVGRSVYEGTYKKCKAEGKSEEEAKDMALFAADEAVNSTQQSQEAAFMSPIQTSKGLASVAARKYQNSPFSWGRKIHQWIREVKKWSNKGELLENAKKMYIQNGYEESEAQSKAEQDLKRWEFRLFTVPAVMWFCNVGWASMAVFPLAASKSIIANSYGGNGSGDDDDELENRRKVAAEEDANDAYLQSGIKSMISGTISSLLQGYAGTSFVQNGITNFIAETLRAYTDGDENTFFDHISAASFNTIFQDDLGYSVLDMVNGIKSDDGTRVLLSTVKLGSVLGVGVDPDVLTNIASGIYYACQKDKVNEVDVAYAIAQIATMPKDVRDELALSLRVYDGTPEQITERMWRALTYFKERKHKAIYEKLSNKEIQELTKRITYDMFRPNDTAENVKHAPVLVEDAMRRSVIDKLDEIINLAAKNDQGMSLNRFIKSIKEVKEAIGSIEKAKYKNEDNVADDALPTGMEFHSYFRDPDFNSLIEKTE